MPVPTTVYQGTTFSAAIACSQYPPTGWAAGLAFSKSGATPFTLNGADAGDGQTFEFSALPATTTAWAAGDWNWSLLVNDGTDTHLVATGVMSVLVINATTALQHARDYLAQVRAALALASGQTSSYSIKDRSLTRRSVSELMDLEGYWLRRVNDLQQAETIACGTKTGNRRITYGRFA